MLVGQNTKKMKYEKGSFIVVPNRQMLSGMKGPVQAVYLWLCFHSNQDGTCYPSVNTLSREAGVSKKMVNKAIKTLETAGILQKENRENENKEKLTNLYTIIIGGGDGSESTPVAKTTLPRVENAPTPRVENAPRTVSSIKLKELNSNISKESFEKFWEAYGKKVGKVNSMRVWQSKELWRHIDEILVFIAAAEKTDRWINGYKKDPERFLRLECWNDDIATYADRKEKGMEILKVN